MAGIKGKGGVKGRSGGPRSGAGRKKVEQELDTSYLMAPEEVAKLDMLELLQNIALGRIAASTTQVRAAIAAVQYTHAKKADGGKKEEKQDLAKKAGEGKFSMAKPPLSIVKS